MREISVLVSFLALLVASASSAFALAWDCGVPEIDASAGFAAIAALVSVGMMAYDRRRRR